MWIKICFVSFLFALGALCGTFAQDIEPEFLPPVIIKTTAEPTTTTEHTYITTEIQTIETEPTTTTEDDTITEPLSTTTAISTELSTTTEPTETTSERNNNVTEPTSTAVDATTDLTTTTSSAEHTTTPTTQIATTTAGEIPLTTQTTRTYVTPTTPKRRLGCRYTRRIGTPYYCWREKRFRVPVYCTYCCNCFGRELCYYVNQMFCRNI